MSNKKGIGFVGFSKTDRFAIETEWRNEEEVSKNDVVCIGMAGGITKADNRYSHKITVVGVVNEVIHNIFQKKDETEFGKSIVVSHYICPDVFKDCYSAGDKMFLGQNGKMIRYTEIEYGYIVVVGIVLYNGDLYVDINNRDQYKP